MKKMLTVQKPLRKAEKKFRFLISVKFKEKSLSFIKIERVFKEL